MKCSYYRIIVRYPYLVILVTLVVVLSLSVIGFLQFGADYLAACFEDPTLGFEARGTEISDKTIAMINLDQSIPDENNWFPNISGIAGKSSFPRWRHGATDDPTCAERPVNGDYSKFVFESNGGNNLMTPDHLRAICDLEDDVIRSYFRYDCRSHSVALYVAALGDKNCSDITIDDVTNTTDLLLYCYPYYADGSLLEYCTALDCPTVPTQCYTYQAVYSILHYHADLDFVEQIKNQDEDPFLTFAMLILSDYQDYETRKSYFHDEVDGKDLKNDLVWISAMDLDYTFDLFTYYMITDMVYFVLALVVIIVILLLYLRSILLAVATFLNVIFSYTVAYFVYHIIFRFEFFPFVNLFAILLLIAIGADNIFIFYDSWEGAKLEIPEKPPNETDDDDDDPKVGDIMSMGGNMNNQPIMAYEGETQFAGVALPGEVDPFYVGGANTAFEDDGTLSPRDEYPPEGTTDRSSDSESTKPESGYDTDRKDAAPLEGAAKGPTTYGSIEDLNEPSLAGSTDPLGLDDVTARDLSDFMELWMRDAFRHAASSILVTSLATASALFANFVSKVIVIRCFGIFTMTAILVNFLLMITWIPAFLVLNERLKRAMSSCCESKCCHGDTTNVLTKFTGFLVSAKNAFFCEYLPLAVSNIWFIWIPLLFCVGIGGIVVVFVTPGLQLPSTLHFPLFPADHPFEKYNSELKWMFAFENPDSSDGMILDFMWGVDDRDNGNVLNPFDYGYLKFDPDVELFLADSQIWMVDFCETLKNETFVSEMSSQLECSYTMFWDVLGSPCRSILPNVSSPCCDTSVPANDSLFEYCTPRLTAAALLTGHYPWLGNHLYDQSTNQINAFAIELTSSHPFTADFDVMDSIYKELDSFMDQQLSTAPVGLQDGWFFGAFSFYDLQRELARGTYSALAISIAIALFFLLVTTWNVLLSLYAIIAISFCIFVTIGTLVLMGWELNIVESSIFTISVGLSIDFTIHYGVSYLHSHKVTRKEKVKETFERVGSAVAMAAVTTFLAGACIMPSNIIAYQQLGTFLMLVMVYSWTFSTFLFQATLAVIGPLGDFMQITCTCVTRCCGRKDGSDVAEVESQNNRGSVISDSNEEAVQGTSYKTFDGSSGSNIVAPSTEPEPDYP